MVYDRGVRWWPWGNRGEGSGGVAAPSNLLPTDQLQIAAMLRMGGVGLAGVTVTEETVLGISAFYRGIEVIAGQLSTLPMPTYRTLPDGTRKLEKSIFDDPDGVNGMTVAEWKYALYANMIMHGRAGCLKLRNQAGGLDRLQVIHPSRWTVRAWTPKDGDRPAGGLWFDVSLDDGRAKTYDASGFWYLPGISLDGVNVISLLDYAATSLATTIAGDQAAGRLFTTGAMVAGMLTPDDEEDIAVDVPQIRREVDQAFLGYEKAGGIAILARRLKWQAMQMTSQAAQFLESRQFQVEEVARYLGVPPHLLMQTEKQTSWGTGVEMQDRALGRTVLNRWATQFEQRASRLLANPRYVEVDFSVLERPAPEKEVELDLAQVAAGVMTVDEYRVKRGWEPMPEQPEPEPAAGPDSNGGDDDPTAE